jgi:hypothetical protein
MKTFQLVRDVDYSGVSGTGIVAEGVEFDDGKVVIQWVVPNKPSSLVIWDDMADALEIHGHDGATRVEYL